MRLYGILKKEFELALEEDLKVSFAFQNTLYSLEIEEDYFWILVEGICLPWELEEE